MWGGCVRKAATWRKIVGKGEIRGVSNMERCGFTERQELLRRYMEAVGGGEGIELLRIGIVRLR